VGLGLIPACAAGAVSLWEFAGATFSEVLFFWVGALSYLVLLGIFQQPIRTYVFGHELTHVLWVYLCGGSVRGFQAGAAGGKVRATRANALVFLAPYIFPVYSILLLGVWLGAGLFLTLEPGKEFFAGLLGFSWAFHLTFTLFFLFQGQPDLAAAGRIFSLPVIWLANLAVLALLLAFLVPEEGAGGFFGPFWRRLPEYYRGVADLLARTPWFSAG